MYMLRIVDDLPKTIRSILEYLRNVLPNNRQTEEV